MKFLTKGIILALIYLTLLLTFQQVQDPRQRFLIISLIYLLGFLFLNLGFYDLIMHTGLAFLAVLTESNFIRFFNLTWDYRTFKKDSIINVPYWLYPLWIIAILIIIESSKVFPVGIKYLKTILKQS